MKLQDRKEATISDLVAERSNRSLFFEKLGIDYCCGGKRKLEEVCQSKGLDVENVLNELAQFDSEKEHTEAIDWSQASISRLIDHVLDVHHPYTKEALDRLDRLVNKVANVHGTNHPELIQVRHIFSAMKAELLTHMQKEEQVLFPYCQQMATVQELVPFHCGSVANPIKVMEMEHEDCGKQLEAMRALTHNYTPPEDACNTYRAMLDGLVELEADLHQHIHLENNLLFPKVLERAQELQCTP